MASRASRMFWNEPRMWMCLRHGSTLPAPGHGRVRSSWAYPRRAALGHIRVGKHDARPRRVLNGELGAAALAGNAADRARQVVAVQRLDCEGAERNASSTCRQGQPSTFPLLPTPAGYGPSLISKLSMYRSSIRSRATASCSQPRAKGPARTAGLAAAQVCSRKCARARVRRRQSPS